MKKISIIVPVYNTEAYLPKCLDSLVNQSLEDIEIIVINDGSSDNSQSVVDRYKKEYPDKIKCLSQENSGQAVARNEGFKVATGEYIACVDSDDYIDDGSLEILYNLAKEKNLDILSFSYKEVRKDATILVPPVLRNVSTHTQLFLEQSMVCTKLFKREFVVKNNLQFVGGIYYEDLEFVPRAVALTDKVDWADLYPYNYIVRESSTMHQKKFNVRGYDIFIALESLEKALKEQHPEEIEYLYIEHLLFSAVGRFLCYDERKALVKKVSATIKEKFPDWKNNRFFKMRNIKYRLFCIAAYHNLVSVLRIFLKLRQMLKS